MTDRRRAIPSTPCASLFSTTSWACEIWAHEQNPPKKNFPNVNHPAAFIWAFAACHRQKQQQKLSFRQKRVLLWYIKNWDESSGSNIDLNPVMFPKRHSFFNNSCHWLSGWTIFDVGGKGSWNHWTARAARIRFIGDTATTAVLHL